MNKFALGVQGYISCFGWIFVTLFQCILEKLPDLKVWERRSSWNDYIRYAERVNGRLAMLTIAFLLFRSLAHGFKFDTVLF